MISSLFSKKIPVTTDRAKIQELLDRGTEDVFIKESLEKKLLSGKRLRIKLGIDPTSSNIHLGRATVLHKLRAFQDLGHQVVLIVGDFTALIGDPSDKLEKRPMLTPAKIQENLKNYKKTLGKIVDLDRAEFAYNSTWLSKLGFSEIATLAESFSVQQMLSRRNFKDRIEKGEDISLREFLYPLMQGYDSVAVKADVELGGFDQLFNLKAGRIIQKHYGQPEQDVITFNMLEGTDGRKMSSSWGNVINITDAANDMFGKVMSLKDELIIKYFTLCTEVSLKEVDAFKIQIEGGANPRDIKVILAKEIVSRYYDKKTAESAAAAFENTFKKGGIPDDAHEAKVSEGTFLVDILLEHELVSSKSDFRRLIDGGGVSIVEKGGTVEKITDPLYKITRSIDLKIGARRFIKIVAC